MMTLPKCQIYHETTYSIFYTPKFPPTHTPPFISMPATINPAASR